MRLFIAVNFTDEINKTLMKAVGELRGKTISGNFTKEANLHLTLAFIGETERAQDIIKILDECEFRPFSITIGGNSDDGGCGCFKRYGGDIWWAGIQPNPALKAVAKRIAAMLTEAGFTLQEREFKPHVTLGREVNAQRRVTLEIPRQKMDVSRVSLMKSERTPSGIAYSEVYGREF